MVQMNPLVDTSKPKNKPKTDWSTTEKFRNNLTAWLFISPATLIIFIFGIFPIGYALYMSFFSWRVRPRYTYCLPNLQEEWNNLPPGPARIDEITKLWELDFATEFLPNFNMGACFKNYTDIIGDYTGLLVFIVGLASLFVIPWVWNRIYSEQEGRKLNLLKYTIAPFALFGAFFYMMPLIGDFIAGESVGVFSFLLRLFISLMMVMLARWLWRTNPKTDSYTLLRLGVSTVLLFISLYIISMGWNTMMEASPRKAFLEGLIYTVYYAVGSIPLQLGLGLLLAYVLYRNIWGKELWRVIFFLPYITPAVAAAVVFRTVFSPRQTSLANQFINALGFDNLRWIQDPTPITKALFGLEINGFLEGPSIALVSVILLGIWTYVGYNAVIFLAGMGNVPNDLYEAARVDGANEWHLFRYITLPLLSPVTFYLSILGFIGTFKAFNTLFVMRETQALGTTDTASIVVFQTFRANSDYGLATAQAVVLLIIILAITQFQRTVLEKRVFYG